MRHCEENCKNKKNISGSNILNGNCFPILLYTSTHLLCLLLNMHFRIDSLVFQNKFRICAICIINSQIGVKLETYKYSINGKYEECRCFFNDSVTIYISSLNHHWLIDKWNSIILLSFHSLSDILIKFYIPFHQITCQILCLCNAWKIILSSKFSLLYAYRWG